MCHAGGDDDRYHRLRQHGPSGQAGIASACLALTIMAFARQGWTVFAVMPVFALGGIGVPALQSLAARLVDENRQGQFQGVLASTVSFASIGAPLVFSTLYFVVQKQWPGAIWLSVVAVYVMTVPLLLGLKTRSAAKNETRVSAASQ